MLRALIFFTFKSKVNKVLDLREIEKRVINYNQNRSMRFSHRLSEDELSGMGLKSVYSCRVAQRISNRIFPSFFVSLLLVGWLPRVRQRLA